MIKAVLQELDYSLFEEMREIPGEWRLVCEEAALHQEDHLAAAAALLKCL